MLISRWWAIDEIAGHEPVFLLFAQYSFIRRDMALRPAVDMGLRVRCGAGSVRVTLRGDPCSADPARASRALLTRTRRAVNARSSRRSVALIASRFDVLLGVFPTAFIPALDWSAPRAAAGDFVGAVPVLLEVRFDGGFLLVGSPDALFFVALGRDASFLRAAGFFVLAICVGVLLVRVFLGRRARRWAVSPAEAAAVSRSMPKTDDMSSVFKRRRRPLFFVGPSVTAAAINSAGSTPRSVKSISGSSSSRAPTP